MPVAARPLQESDVDPDPFTQFARWYDDAVEHGQLQPDAMIVATSTPEGFPSVRLVLLRGTDGPGFSFFTNFESRKGRELSVNPQAAIAFHWPEVLRQVRATGAVELVDDAAADAYWYSRPRSSRVSVWASAQSAVAEGRPALEARVAEVEARFDGADVPRPANWGGYRVLPEEIEFWQHRDDRLHDRLRYTRTGRESWRIDRLQP